MFSRIHSNVHRIHPALPPATATAATAPFPAHADGKHPRKKVHVAIAHPLHHLHVLLRVRSVPPVAASPRQGRGGGAVRGCEHHACSCGCCCPCCRACTEILKHIVHGQHRPRLPAHDPVPGRRWKGGARGDGAQMPALCPLHDELY